jgi:hypothetical protein
MKLKTMSHRTDRTESVSALKPSIVKQLLVGPFPEHHQYANDALPNQWSNILAIWNNEKDPTFGLERLFRLFIAIAAFVFPGIYIRHFTGKRGLLARKLALDLYVTLKLAAPAIILCLDWHRTGWAIFLASYMGLETLFYVAGIMFLSDIYMPAISQKRSYLMFMMNYIEMCFNFAILYGGLGLVSNVKSPLDAVYFSFVTGFTVGYGDMFPTSDGGKLLMILQSICSLFFITLALARAVASFEKNNARNTNP